jgi:hypothetical protein
MPACFFIAFPKGASRMPFMPLPRSSRRTAFAMVIASLLAACADVGDYAAADIASGLARPSGTANAPTPPASPEEPRDWLFIHGTLNVRAEPNKNASIVRTLRHGDMVQLGPGDARGWARIYTGAVEDEYVYRASDLVRTTSPAAPATLSDAAASPGRGRRRSSAESGGYHLGPRGGCYTYTSSGRKRYVDRSNCR